MTYWIHIRDQMYSYVFEIVISDNVIGNNT